MIYTEKNRFNDPTLIACIYQTELMKRLFSHYGDVLIMDTTFNITTNHEHFGWKKMSIMGVNGLGLSELLICIILKDETSYTLDKTFSKLSETNDFSISRCIFTDKDLKEIKIIKNFFINAKNLLCDIHVQRHFDEHLKKIQKVKFSKMPLNGKPQVPQTYQSSLTNCEHIEITLTKREQSMTKGKIVQIIQCSGREKAGKIIDTLSWKYFLYFKKNWAPFWTK